MNPKKAAILSARLQAWLALGVFIATMSAFAGSLWYADRTAIKLDENAISITANASVAIEHLSIVRGEIFRIQTNGILAVEPGGGSTNIKPEIFIQSLKRIEDELAAYQKVPLYPEEQPHFEKARQAIRRLETQTHAFLNSENAGAALGAGFARATANANQAIEELIAFNAAELRRLGAEIPALRKLANRKEYTLSGLFAVLGIILMMLVVRAIVRYEKLLQHERQLADEQATKLAEFSAKLESINQATVNIANAIFHQSRLESVLEVIAGQACQIVNADYCRIESESLGMQVCRDSNDEPRNVANAYLQDGPVVEAPIVHVDRVLGKLTLAREPGRVAFCGNDERIVGFFSAYVGVAIDNARLYAKAQEAIRAREDLLAIVSHDLKNPLSAIRMASELIGLPAGQGRATELATRIDTAAARMLALVNGLLDAAKIEAGLLRVEKRPHFAPSLTAEAIEAFSIAADEKAIQLVPVVAPGTPMVLCERPLIQRVLSNLIANAIKFTPNHGKITVGIEPSDRQVKFSVSDTGAGVDAAYLPHVFERYWQQSVSDRRGSGLGLYITKGIVEAHDGQIWVESKPGEGATFYFTLQAVEHQVMSALEQDKNVGNQGVV